MNLADIFVDKRRPCKNDEFERVLPFSKIVSRTIRSIKPLRSDRLPNIYLSGLQPRLFVINTMDGKFFFCSDASYTVHTSEGCCAPDFSLLLKAGMMDYDMVNHIVRKLDKRHEQLTANYRELGEIRREFKQKIAEYPDNRKLKKEYTKKMKSIQQELDLIKEKLYEYDKVWIDNNSNIRCLSNWIPNLIDIFKYDSYETPIDHYLSNSDLTVKDVHKIYDSKGTNHGSQDVYALEFDNGCFSTGISIYMNESIDCNPKELYELGIIPYDVLSSILGKNSTRDQFDDDDNDDDDFL